MDERERSSLVDLVEEFRLSLTSRATGGGFEDQRYQELRRTLLGAPGIAEVLPQFVRICRTTGDFWTWIKSQFSTYDERRNFLREAFEPVLTRLEGIEDVTATELAFGELIGRGGFGSVYKVHHQLLDLDFAVKVFDPAFDDGSPTALDRFFREARVLVALNHPNIIRIFDAGYHRKRPFIRMEYFDGKDLGRAIRDHGVFSPAKALAVTRLILSALVHAHEDGKVMHRDLKPSNVMVAPGERLKVVDFGLGLFVENDLVSRLTRTGEMATAGYYTAPELVQDPKQIDVRADLFSVGAIWYTCLLGRPPLGLDAANSLQAVSGLPPRYIAAIIRSLGPVEKRFASARVMLEEVNNLRPEWNIATELEGWLQRG